MPQPNKNQENWGQPQQIYPEQVVISINDLSFLPEPHLLQNGLDDIVDYSEKNKDLIKSLIEISDLMLHDYDEVSSQIKDA